LETALTPNKYFFQLGKLLVSKKPEVAKALISEYFEQNNYAETDLSKIPFYFNRFCQLQQLNREDYIGPVYKSSKIDKRRYFIATIILLYPPHTRLLAKYISETLKQDPGDTTRMMQECEFRYNKIEEFKKVVDEMVKVLIKS
jgi:hypothetical protein